ncbi:MAG: TetR/AcrR family transcriptional regulator [Alphaproteobacteria bacterium]|nr:MAG: TetR/AcrR family transcriptional regulator [Alphaproteobacteria bacterium]
MTDTANLDQKALLRKEALIQVARRLFAEHGLAGTTLEMITSEVGGSRRTIYELFGNKDGVFEAVVRDCTQRALSIIHSIDVSNRPIREALIEFGINLMSFLTSEDTVRQLRLFISEVPRFPQLGRFFYENGLMAGRLILKDYLQHQMDEGVLARADPEQAALFLVSLIKADYDMRQMTHVGWEPGEELLRKHVIDAVDLFLHGYAVKA